MTPNFDNVIKKDLDSCFIFIKEVESCDNYIISSNDSSLNNGKAHTYIEESEFTLAIYTNDLLSQDERNSLLESKALFKISNDRRNLIFDFKSFSHMTTLFMDEPNRFNFTIKKYHNTEIKDNIKKYYRVIIPTNIEQKPGSIFQSDSFDTNSIIHFKGLVTITLQQYSFHLFAYNDKTEEKYYLVIDSLDQINYKGFKNYIDIILLAYSFVTGYFPRDKRYILSSTENDFKNIYGISFETLPKSLESSYSVFPRSDLRIYFNLPQNINFPQMIFNKLCSVLLRHIELNRVLFLIVEGHTLSMELRAAIYSVALETITNIICKENESKVNPITDKKLAKLLISELKDALLKYSDKISKTNLETIIKKIDLLNSPTNKQKLLKPFEILNITLNEKEKECINKRNDFLHGRIPFESDDDSEYQLQQIVLTLLYCVTILVLKYVDYSGFVLYYPSINEFKREKKISDYIIKMI